MKIKYTIFYLIDTEKLGINIWVRLNTELLNYGGKACVYIQNEYTKSLV